MIKNLLLRLRYKKRVFFIAEQVAEAALVKPRTGYAYKGIAVFQSKPNEWSLTHLATGHNIFYVRGDLQLAMQIGRELADGGDWRRTPEDDEHYMWGLFLLAQDAYKKYAACGMAFQIHVGMDSLTARTAGLLNT